MRYEVWGFAIYKGEPGEAWRMKSPWPGGRFFTFAGAVKWGKLITSDPLVRMACLDFRVREGVELSPGFEVRRV